MPSRNFDLDDELQREFEEIKTEALSLLTGLTESQLISKPASRRWSIAECLDHLIITGRQSLTHIDEAIRIALLRRMYSSGPFRYGRLERLIVHLMGPDTRFRFRAPPAYRPTMARPVATLLPEFLALQDDLLVRVKQSEGLDLVKVKVRNPVTRWIRLSLGQELRFVAAHERRHLEQIRQIKAFQCVS